jgi:hypothetical protein
LRHGARMSLHWSTGRNRARYCPCRGRLDA